MKTKSQDQKSKAPTFGAPSLPNSQLDASRLVGGIVERGFSGQPLNSPSAVPRPTVRSFPEARHRSDGPLWAPPVGAHDGGSLGDMDVENNEEDENLDHLEQTLAFAIPLQRKKKKGLDFSGWPELMSSTSNVVPKNNQVISRNNVNRRSKTSELVEISNGLGKPAVSTKNGPPFSRMPTGDNMDMADMDPAVLQVVKEEEVCRSAMAMGVEQGNLRTELNEHYKELECSSLAETSDWDEGTTSAVTIDSKEKKMMEIVSRSSELDSMAHNKLSNNMVDEHGGNSLESQIDSENRVRIQTMTDSEIAEAQSEIISKLSPALLNALKKRGQDKLKGKTKLLSVKAQGGEVRHSDLEKNLVNAPVGNGSHNKKMKENSTSIQSHQFHQSVSDLWSSWSARVEAVRELRFSLDGKIIELDFAQLPETGSCDLNSYGTLHPENEEYNFSSSVGSVSAQNWLGLERVSERDFIRTEGDPGAIGYTIKEAVSLMRSVVPGQRALALQLIASVLDKALQGILQNKVGPLQLACAGTDWEAIWAFALGPEPELALSLRICLDDAHDSVVLACAKVIQSVLSCGVNEIFFEMSEKIPSIQDDLSTAPVFRAKPEIDVGFLGGGFWKYSAKPSNILSHAEDVNRDPEGENTIQDDVVVAGQDVVAGLVRMGILTRIRFLLEMEPSGIMEDCLLSILIAIARHSQTCAAAIMKCDGLVQTVVNRFTTNELMRISPSKIKTVILLKVLARMERKNCMELVMLRTVHKVTWHLCRETSLEQWINSGKEVCGLSSLLLVEQLRLWKVCIRYGYCVSYFSDVFPALRVWLDVTSIEKLVDGSNMSGFAAISKEAYHVIEALAKRLPNFYSVRHTAEATAVEADTWCWSYVGPLIDLALEWTALKQIPSLSRYFNLQKVEDKSSMLEDASLSSLLFVVSSVMHMFSAVLEAVIPLDTMDLNSTCLPWLPEFVPRIGLNLIKNGYFCFSDVSGSDGYGDFSGDSSFVELMCHLRYNTGQQISLACSSCLQGLIQVTGCVDKLIQLAKPELNNSSSDHGLCFVEDEILTYGIIHSSQGELRQLLTTLMRSALDLHPVQSIEIFGRGGPAPGVAVGWGASGGGFWSSSLLLAQVDARLIARLLEIFSHVPLKDPFSVDHARSCIQMISSVLQICLIAGPRDTSLLDKLFDLIFQAPVLKCLDISIHHFLQLQDGLETFGWKYEEDEYVQFCSILASHFRRRWLLKKKGKLEGHRVTKNKSTGSASLDTIYEGIEPSNMEMEVTGSLVQEWACQRLPLPNYWFLSSISATYSFTSGEANDEQEKANFVEVGQAGLFFLLGVEALHVLLAPDLCCVVHNVPVVWKLHALSVLLVDGMCVLESEKGRDTYGALQNVYGQLIDESRLANVGGKEKADFLNFKSEVHESYSSFVEILVEQFAAVSYGDTLFGRQVTMYLHRRVESSVRLAAWSALSHSHALELLPRLEECAAQADGYLEPIEDDEKMLEAYAKSWVSGALDKAATRGSVSYTLALHHLACFIFGDCVDDKVSQRNELVKSLLREYSRKRDHEGMNRMMMSLLQYKKPSTQSELGAGDTFRQLEDRTRILREACEGSVSLVKEVEKLRCNCAQKWPGQ